MKKFIVLFITVLMVISICSCSGDNSTVQTSTTDNSATNNKNKNDDPNNTNDPDNASITDGKDDKAQDNGLIKSKVEDVIFSYPDTVDAEVEENLLFIYFGENGLSATITVQTVQDVNEGQENEILDTEFSQNYYDTFVNSHNYAKVISKGTEKLNGVDALKIIISEEDGDVKKIFGSYIFIHSGKFYRILTSVDASVEDKYSKQMDSIINSVEYY